MPEVRSAISGMFLAIGWDVRRNRSPPHVRVPPSGAMMKELLAKTVRASNPALLCTSPSSLLACKHTQPTRLCLQGCASALSLSAPRPTSPTALKSAHTRRADSARTIVCECMRGLRGLRGLLCARYPVAVVVEADHYRSAWLGTHPFVMNMHTSMSLTQRHTRRQTLFTKRASLFSVTLMGHVACLKTGCQNSLSICLHVHLSMCSRVLKGQNTSDVCSDMIAKSSLCNVCGLAAAVRSCTQACM